MWKPISVAVFFLASAISRADDRLTDIENRWLNAGAAVLDYAEAQSLPIDIIVQPDSNPGAAPLAMGFDGSRCKLVFSLRGNPDAESVLANIAPAKADLAIEVMFAHEIAHCWRFMNGAWHALPAGFSARGTVDTGSGNGSTHANREMQQTRREEGLADLVGLAWALRRRPQHYREVHDWLEKVRQDQTVSGGHHDTRLWIRLAQDRSAFETDGTLFEQARALWAQGLRAEQ